MNLVPRLLESFVPGIMALAVVGGAMTPLEAQTLLVGNLGQPVFDSMQLQSSDWEAQSFTNTGLNHYKLYAIDLALPIVAGSPNVSLYASMPDGSEPTVPLVTFNAGEVLSGTTYRFKPGMDYTLDAGATYWIVVLAPGTSWDFIYSLAVDPGSLGTISGSYSISASTTSAGGSWVSGNNISYQFAVHYENGTVVTLESFTAQTASKGVTLAWTTGSEVDAAGFNIWRSATADGEYTRLNASLLPSTAVSPGGASYTWTDTTAGGTSGFYKLEDMDTAGVGTMHGPVSTGTSTILTFQATPPSIFTGGIASLNWTTSGSPALSLDGAAVTGSCTRVSPTATTSYTLSDGPTSVLATVTVKPFGLQDMAGLSLAWGSTRGTSAYNPCYDLNGDGNVDDADVALCLAGF